MRLKKKLKMASKTYYILGLLKLFKISGTVIDKTTYLKKDLKKREPIVEIVESEEQQSDKEDEED